MIKFFTSRKIERDALNIYREMWEKNMAVSVNRGEYGDKSVRLNCGRFQLHIQSPELSARCRWQSFMDTDSKLLKTFAVALSCSNHGEYFNKFSHLVSVMTLDGTNTNIF